MNDARDEMDPYRDHPMPGRGYQLLVAFFALASLAFVPLVLRTSRGVVLDALDIVFIVVMAPLGVALCFVVVRMERSAYHITYEITDGRLVLRRGARSAEVWLSDVENVWVVRSIRHITERKQVCETFANRLGRGVLINLISPLCVENLLAERWYYSLYLTPSDPDAFIAAVQGNSSLAGLESI